MPLVKMDSTSNRVGTITVQKDGSTVAVVPTVNMVTGTNTTLTVNSNTSNNRVDITVDAPNISVGAATALKTTGANVDVSASAPPSANQVLTASTSLAASWQNVQAAPGLKMSNGTVTVSGNIIPSSGQVLTATSTSAANWATPSTTANALACSGGSVNVSAAAAPSANQILQASSSSAASWVTLAAGGDVAGPSASTDSELPLFSGTGGKTLKRSNTLNGAVSLTSGVVAAGTLALSNGGTGQTTAQAAINAFMAASGALSQGDVFYYNGTNVVRLAAGTSGNFLKTNGAGANPAWASVSGVTAPTLSKSLSIPSPGSSENITIFFTPVALTITKVVTVIQGSSSQTVTWNLYKASDRSTAGTKVFNSDQTTTNTTTGSTLTSFDSASISANNFFWFQTSASGGTVNEFVITIVYTEP